MIALLRNVVTLAGASKAHARANRERIDAHYKEHGLPAHLKGWAPKVAKGIIAFYFIYGAFFVMYTGYHIMYPMDSQQTIEQKN